MKEMMKKMIEMVMKIDDLESDEQFEAIEEFSIQTMELTAKVNWKYFTFLKEAGFTEEQAMQMVIAGQNNG
ncbi:hypothetical protein PMV48_05805 [Enterococcus avium]|uniref:hypothetical protein n=1 Tax=Enterococcus avium TaxID=33945 RepID=UPI0006616C03|nr:hypothetical protein [Enterococcus avium]MDB1723277.1 hypothetical protein [Enterococcus avium]